MLITSTFTVSDGLSNLDGFCATSPNAGTYTCSRPSRAYFAVDFWPEHLELLRTPATVLTALHSLCFDQLVAHRQELMLLRPATAARPRSETTLRPRWHGGTPGNAGHPKHTLRSGNLLGCPSFACPYAWSVRWPGLGLGGQLGSSSALARRVFFGVPKQFGQLQARKNTPASTTKAASIQAPATGIVQERSFIPMKKSSPKWQR